jgi:hypothetical protein
LQFSLQAASPETFGYTLVSVYKYYYMLHNKFTDATSERNKTKNSEELEVKIYVKYDEGCEF